MQLLLEYLQKSLSFKNKPLPYVHVMKYFKNPVYYIFLLFKKIKVLFHNILEPHVNTLPKADPEEFKIFLWQQKMKNLSFHEKGCYFRTNITNKKSPMALSQARTILILCNDPTLSEPKFRSAFLIKKLTDYLISMRDSNGLFKFNQASWDLQDEGIASVWSTLALIKAYEVTNEKYYLEVAISTLNAMLSNLYTRETSLIHTAGDYFWCLNSASTFAYACSLMLNHHYSDEIKEAMIDSINLCIDKIGDDGHYPYNLKRQGTYLLLYHPIVMITLDCCLLSEYLDNKTRQRIVASNKIAQEFLLKCIDKEKRIFEPEVTHYGQYIITNVATLLALKGKIETDLEKTLLNNIATFWKNDELYLCKDKNNRLYNSDLYSVKDVLAIEVLYWLDLYQKPQNL